ncbi:Holliday junction resolvase RuvX [Polyangium jinanense]|uniref:Putative pre-16S rRNA nuclease n=2 Tax=Polyangium jinanense TaxID=2829994 RepID=A0A9X4AVU0_9BACT|nr:Holliday junction resolvase RuvX [Polyangium jinanense]MDC3984697.1 Holliday junction resolvase RuvX [Polyangium jinanense]
MGERPGRPPNPNDGGSAPTSGAVPPNPPRVCALDLGKARVGVAIADELGLLAHPRPPLDGRDKKALIRALGELAREEGVGLFLVGLPLDMSGAYGPMATRAADLAQEISQATGVPVELFDERWTTVEAARKLREGGTSAKRQKGVIDGMAAAVMLQAYLDRAQGLGSADALAMPPPPPRGRGGRR